MFAYDSSFCATKLIKDNSLYLGIFDLSSSVNSVGKFMSLFHEAERKSRKDAWLTLGHFNESWINLAEQGELLSWITLFHGVFKVELRLLTEIPQVEFNKNETNRFLGDGEANRIFLPTGEIVVASLGDLGTELSMPLAKIESGWYRVGFFCDHEKENEHTFLEEESEYPADSSPDWILYLQRIPTD